MRYDYDMLGNRIHQASMEAGERWMLNDVAGKPICGWDSRTIVFRTTYDACGGRRGLSGRGTARSGWSTVPSMARGQRDPERKTSAAMRSDLRRRGRRYQRRYDFKGNLLRTSRQLRSNARRPSIGESVPADEVFIRAPHSMRSTAR